MKHYEKEFCNYVVEFVENNWEKIEGTSDLYELTFYNSVGETKEDIKKKCKKNVNFAVRILEIFDSDNLNKQTDIFCHKLTNRAIRNIVYVLKIKDKIYGIYEKFDWKEMENKFYIRTLEEKTITVYDIGNK